MTGLDAGTETESTNKLEGFRPYTIENSQVRAPCGSNDIVLVAHSSPVIRAGLATVLRRLEGCEVRVSAVMSEISALAGDVVVLDELAVAAQFSTCAAIAGESMRALAPKLVLITKSPNKVRPAGIVFTGVSACLSVDCPEEELLGTVQGLLPNALPARWSPAPSTDAAPRRVPSSAPAAPRVRPTGGLAPGALRKVREHVDAHLTQRIEPRSLARIAGLSKSYFYRAFKQSIGMPPHRYVMMRRLAAAAELVKTTYKPLADVAIETGFSDQSHFTRMFTQTTGETPGTLRRRCR